VSASRATLAALLAATLWGTTGTTAYLIGGVVPAVVIGAVTMGFGGAVLLALGGRSSLLLMTHPGSRVWVWWGGLAVVVYPLAFYQGMYLAGVAVGNIVALGSGPIAVAVIEWVVDKRPPTKQWLVATIMAVVGMAALILGDLSETSAQPGGVIPGIGLALLAGVSYALFSYAMGATMARGHSPLHTVGAVFGAGALPLIVVAAVGGAGVVWSGATIGYLGYLVIGPMVIAYLFFSRALRVLTSSSVLTIALVEPAVATLLAVAVVGERFDVLGLIGIALLGVAVVMVSRGAIVR
jgi:drug/metabolite transporter, DME family